jgi:NAD(P) transhydrogenase
MSRRESVANWLVADVPNPMFYMPGTRMLFGDARVTTEAIKSAIEARFK